MSSSVDHPGGHGWRAGDGRGKGARARAVRRACPQDVVVPVTVASSGAAATASGSFTIKRLAFKVGEGEWTDTSMLADDVQVRFKLQLAGLGPL